MIYALSGTSQNQLLARVSVERRHCRVFSLAQRCHIVTLVDRALQYGVSINHAVDNLQVSPSLFAGGVRIFKTSQILKVVILTRTMQARWASWMISRRNSLPLCLTGEIVECL